MDKTNSTKEINVFQKLQLLMDYIEIESEFIPAQSAENPEKLFITLNKQDHTEDRFPLILKVLFLNDLNKSSDKKNSDDINNQTDLMEFYLDYPVIVSEANILATNVLLMKFNALLPIGSFNINENNNVYFRYVLLTENRDVATTVFVEIIDMIVFYLDILGIEMLKFSLGRQDIEQAINNGFNKISKILE